ncbi:MAG: insulinase family protein [Thiothrix sp.]|nr:MAG: insulinase family protein [Thiothrix sp.]
MKSYTEVFSIRYLLGFVLLFSLASAQAGPEIQYWVTSNGMKVYYVPAPEIPMIDVRVTFSAGSARDGGAPGLATLTSDMLSQGADGMTADQISEAFEAVGAQFGSGALRDMAWLSLTSLSDPEYIQPALAAFASVLWQPDFPEGDFQRTRKRQLVTLDAEEADPGSIAEKAFFKALYGEHPYAQPTNGTLESVNNIQTKQVRAFYKNYYVAKNGLIAMTGDLDRKTAEKLAETLSSGLAEGEAGNALPKVEPLTESKEIKIPFPSKQAHVLIGQPGIERGNPDYYALYLGNHVLGGGGFTSRFVKEVRVKRGYVYSIYSYFMLMAGEGPFQVGLQTRGTQVDDALKVTRDTLNKFMASGVNDKEINASKQNITGGFPLRIASNSDIVEYLGVIGFYGLPLDYLDTFTKNIEAVGKKEIVDAFKRRIYTDKMITVVVGG